MITPVITAYVLSWQDDQARTDLEVESLRITEDLSWSPRIQVEMTVARWQGAVTLLDPRIGLALMLTVSHESPARRVPVSSSWNLIVTEVYKNGDGATYSVKAQSYDYLTRQQFRPLLYGASSNFRAYLAIASSSGSSGSGVPFHIIPRIERVKLPPNYPADSASNAPTIGAANSSPAPIISFAEPLDIGAENNDMRWFVDRDAWWCIEREETAVPTTANLALTAGYTTSTVREVKDAMALVGLDYGNEVYVGFGAETGYAAQYAAPYGINSGPRISRVERRDLTGSVEATRTRSAKRILSRIIGYGSSKEIVTLAEPDLQVNQTISLREFNGDTARRYLMRSISLMYPSGEMLISTRLPSIIA